MYEKDAADDLFVDNSIDCICGHYALHGCSSNPGTGYLVRPASASVWDRYWHACVHCLRADCLANPDASHYSGLSGRKRSSPLRLCDAGRCPKTQWQTHTFLACRQVQRWEPLVRSFLGLGVISGFWAFVGAGGACFLVLALSSADGKTTSVKLILSGMIVNALLTAFSNFIIAVAGDSDGMMSIKFWTMGSLTRAGWKNIGLITLIVLAAAVFFGRRRRRWMA